MRAAGSLCVHLAQRGTRELLIAGERRARTIGAEERGWPAAHAQLALVREGAPLALDVLARSRRTVVHVTAATTRGRGLPEPCWRVAARPLAGIEGRFTVAGCSAQLLGERALSEAA